MTRSAAVALAALLGAGCGQPKMGQVSGTVTYKGRPVTPGVVQFYPAQGPAAFGGLDADGRFTLTTETPGDGALAGPHRVCVTPFLPGAGDTGPGKPKYDPDPANIPKAYRAVTTTPLTAEVVGGRVTEVTFELKD